MKTKITLLIVLVTMAFSAKAVTIYVRSTGNDTKDGLTVGNAVLTISKAIDKAYRDGDIIDVSGAVNFFDSSLALKHINTSVTIQGDNKTTAIIKGKAGIAISAIQIGTSILTPTAIFKNVTLDGFDGYVPNGTASTDQTPGGVGVLYGGSLICQNVIFSNSYAYFGGAINISPSTSCTAIFEDCYFYKNMVLRFGTTATGAWPCGGAVNIDNSSQDVSVTFDRCLFEGNVSENLGSAIRCRLNSGSNTQSLLVQNCTFTGNINKVSATNLQINYGSAALLVETGNTTAAITADVKVINNTFAYNFSEVTTNNSNAGLRISGAKLDNTATVINNILFSNFNSYSTPQSYSIGTGVLKESRNNITDMALSLYNFETKTKSGFSSGNINGVTTVALDLATTLADNGGATKTLKIGNSGASVAANAGWTTGVPTVDQRNINRAGIPDLGAYENTSLTAITKTNADVISYKQFNDKIIFYNLNGIKNAIVYNATGQMIKNEMINDDTYQLKSSTGLYIVQFNSKKGTSVVKVYLK